MTAYARLIDGGHTTDAICPECAWIEHHTTTQPAQDAVKAHNQARHAYPEHTLEIGEQQP